MKSLFIYGIIIMIMSNSISNVGRASEVAQFLEQCPEWSSLSEGETKSVAQILKTLKSLQSRSTEELRAGVVEFVAKKESFDLGALSKIYVLNRVVFNVPEWENRSSTRFFGGWRGVPNRGNEVAVSWPLSLSPNGELALTGYCEGYSGENYKAIEEFEYFRLKYGRRPANKAAKSGKQ